LGDFSFFLIDKLRKDKSRNLLQSAFMSAYAFRFGSSIEEKKNSFSLSIVDKSSSEQRGWFVKMVLEITFL